jgi:ElaB/YqjD/DUF883 family membrane-anchored ribosome-binding protein
MASQNTQNTQRSSSSGRNGAVEPPKSNNMTGKLGDAANEAFAAASSAAQQATEGAKQTATYAANMVSGQIKELLDRQVVSGADMIGHVASSVQLAADDLDQTVPQVGKLVRGLADRIEIVADDIRDKTAEELVKDVSDFTRRQPALTFGLAALAGFVLYRALKSSTPSLTASPSIQPENEGQSGRRAFNG